MIDRLGGRRRARPYRRIYRPARRRADDRGQNDLVQHDRRDGWPHQHHCTRRKDARLDRRPPPCPQGRRMGAVEAPVAGFVHGCRRGVRSRRRHRLRGDRTTGHLGNGSEPGDRHWRSDPGSGDRRFRQARGDGAGASLYGPYGQYDARRICRRLGVHRFLHERADRGSRKRGRRCSWPAGGGRRSRGGRARLILGQEGGRGEGPRRDLPDGRVRMARIRLRDVRRREWRQSGARGNAASRRQTEISKGRQGPGVRTHLASPAMASAAAVAGRIVDVRRFLESSA